MKSLCFVLRRPGNRCLHLPWMRSPIRQERRLHLSFCATFRQQCAQKVCAGASAYSSPTGVLLDHAVDDPPQNLTIPIGSALRKVQSNKVYLPPIQDAG